VAAGARDYDRDRPLGRDQPKAARSGAGRMLFEHYWCQDEVANRDRRAALKLSVSDT
jgi:hypothetical protein